MLKRHVALLVFMAVFRHAATHMRCGSYCSIGLVESYRGDIRPSENLHAMLASVPYKKELIVMPHCGPHIEMALQYHQELLNLGFAHHIFLGLEPSDCDRLTSMRPELSCVTDSTYVPDYILSGENLLWHYRWKLAARSMRLGFNLLMSDMDAILFRGDIYSFLKSPPLDKVNHLCNPESGSPSYNCNGGMMYFQNVRPDGPVSWVFKEVVWNLLRRGDDHYAYQSKWTNATFNHQTFDQSWIYDALKSAAAGLRVSEILTHQKGPAATYVGFKGQNMTHHHVQAKISYLSNVYQKMPCSYPTPDLLLTSMGISDIPRDHKKLCLGNLTVPNLSYGFPEELGGRAWADGPQGNFSSDFDRMLKEDCPDCPHWPEHRPRMSQSEFEDFLFKPDPSRLIDPSIAPEVFAIAPTWFSSGLLAVRTGTITGPANHRHLGYPILAHIHRWRDMGHPYYYKLETRKVFGRYNYSIGYELLRKRGEPDSMIYAVGKAFRGSQASNTLRMNLSQPISRLIALSPRIDLRRTRTWGEFASILYGLLQVARLSSRIIVLPDIPCETSWLYSREELADPNLNSSLYLAPLAAKVLSWALEYPTDPSSGELIGGWRRSRRRRGLSSRRVQEEDPGWSRRRGLSSEPLNVTREAWWDTHRFKFLIPQSIGEACIHIGSMIKPEFFHWLKHEGREGHPHPTDSNTAFRLQDPDDAELQLKPKVEQSVAGVALRPSAENGWSWFDVQAQVSSSDVAMEMRRISSEPVVYLDHPIMVKGGGSDSGHDVILKALHEELMVEAKENRACLLLVDHEAWLKTRVYKLPDLNHGLQCVVDEATNKLKRFKPTK